MAPGNWTQTPEGRKRLAALTRQRLKGPKGKAQLAAMAAGRAAYFKRLREAKANGHALPISAKSMKTQRKASGRQMLTELAREGAMARAAKLRRELETLELFILKTGGDSK